MAGIVLTIPIMVGKVESWRRFCQEMSGSRSVDHEISRLNQGITRERLALIEGKYGSVAITTFEADDLVQSLTNILASELSFDRWYREQIRALHGIDLTRYESLIQSIDASDHQELHFDWTSPPRHDNGADGLLC